MKEAISQALSLQRPYTFLCDKIAHLPYESNSVATSKFSFSMLKVEPRVALDGNSWKQAIKSNIPK